MFLDYFETFMSCSAKVLLEVSEQYHQKWPLKIILEVENVKTLQF